MHFWFIFSQLVIHAMCWMSKKCFIYEDDLIGMIDPPCPKSNLTGYCTDVFNVAEELAKIPSHLEVLCLELADGASLHPYSFSRFQHLRHLEIKFQFIKLNSKIKFINIFPGAFKNVFSLQSLHIYCTKLVNVTIPSKVFIDLQNLSRLGLSGCSWSSIAMEAFGELPKLKNIFTDGGIDFSELLCRLTLIPLLKNLDVAQSMHVMLNQPNCTFSNGTSFKVKEFKEIETNLLFLGKVTVSDQTVLKYFPKISVLSLDIEEFELLMPRLREVVDLKLNGKSNMGGFKEICETARKLLTTALTRNVYDDVPTSFPLYLETCRMLRVFAIDGGLEQTNAINLTFIKQLKNLTSLQVQWIIKQETVGKDTVVALCENQSDLVTKIKILSLYTNYFKSISNRQFVCLKDLEYLNWSSSKIEYIEDFTFNNTSCLEHLDLSSNKISKLTEYSFFGLHNLNKLLIAENQLIVIETLTFIGLTSLKSLSLGVTSNFTLSETALINLNLSLPENLINLYISSRLKPMTLFLDSKEKLRSGLHLEVHGKSVTFQDCENPLFESLVELTAETDLLLCNQTFPALYLKSLQNLKITARHKMTQMDLTDLNQLVHLESLKLQNIDLSHQPGLDVIFHNLSRLKYMEFFYCWINSLEEDLSRDLQSLKILVLYIDTDFSMMENFIKPLTNLKYLIMEPALFQCSCDNVWFIEWTKYQQSVQVHFEWCTLESLQCKSEDDIKNLHKYAQEYCFLNPEFLLFVSTFVGLLVFMLVVLLHQLAGDYLLAFFHIARGWIEEAMRANKAEHYLFDVFVSYCGKDEQWVVGELLPNLEKRGPPFLRICLHSRDFQLGKDIVENITDSLYRSRYTLCVISRNYLQSNWCSLEMRLATYRLLAEHRDVLVLIFLEKVPSQILNAHHRLARLVKTRTYIDWPKDSALHNAFWDKLWNKLASDSPR